MMFIGLNMLSFRLLEIADFPLLLKWLEAPHVKKFWDSDISYSLEDIQQKYTDYVNGFSLYKGQKKSIKAYILLYNGQAIGYIQLYKLTDFGFDDLELPSNIGGIDFYLGEESFLKRGFASTALKLFLQDYAFTKFRYIFVNPLIKNERAVRCFLKAGFSVIKKHHDCFWMGAFRGEFRLSTKEAIELEIAFKKVFLEQDKLYIFGSRANIYKTGGDIDLYIETHEKSVEQAVAMKNQFSQALFKCFGEQKIDVVLNILNLKTHLPIYDIAKKEGILIK